MKTTASCYWCHWAYVEDSADPSVGIFNDTLGCRALETEGAIAQAYDSVFEHEDPSDAFELMNDWPEQIALNCPGYKPITKTFECPSCGAQSTEVFGQHRWYGSCPESGDAFPVCCQQCRDVEYLKSQALADWYHAIDRACAREGNYPAYHCGHCQKKMAPSMSGHWVIINSNDPQMAIAVCSLECKGQKENRMSTTKLGSKP